MPSVSRQKPTQMRRPPLDSLKALIIDKHPSLCCRNVSYEIKMFYNVDPSSVAEQVDREDDRSAGQRFESPQRQASGDEEAKLFSSSVPEIS